MMTKKDFKQFADAIAEIKNEDERNKLIERLNPVFRDNNCRFDEQRFREWINRRVQGISTKGLR